MDLHFSTKDIGKFVKLADGRVAKILTVIRESGNLHSVYGQIFNLNDIVIWDPIGKSEIPEHNIIEIIHDE